MDDLVQFLRARFDEEAAAAQSAASQEGGGTWEVLRLPPMNTPSVCGRPQPGEHALPVIVEPNDHETSVHIARHDPARVLADVEAKRRITELHSIVHREIGWRDAAGEIEYGEIPVCSQCVPKHMHYLTREDVPEGPCTTLRLLARPYADHHPDYQETWKP